MSIHVTWSTLFLDLAPPPAGHLEYCCGRSSPWVTCRIPAKATKRFWSLSPAEAGWTLLRTVRGLCEYGQEVQCRHQSGSTGQQKLFRQLFNPFPATALFIEFCFHEPSFLIIEINAFLRHRIHLILILF